MLHHPNVLMIGGQEKDAGKTRLSERILTRFSKEGASLAAVKVTVYRDKETEWGYKIWEELDENRHKDTGRLLRAGAVKVLWLKCDEAHLEKGVLDMLEQLPPGPILCESNSARKVVKPACFLMVRREDSGPEMKASAEAVLDYVDQFVVSQLGSAGIRYSPDPLQHLRLEKGNWSWS